MISGNPRDWAEKFGSVDFRIISAIEEIWPKCISRFKEQPLEDQLTINLINDIKSLPALRRLGYAAYQHEPFAYWDNGTAYSLGKIDFAFIIDSNRDIYIAYECKRLNVLNGSGRSSLATAYVKEGLMRFVVEKYSENLPIASMLGYVMDGDIEFAQQRIETAILTNKSETKFSGKIIPMEEVGAFKRFRTNHDRKKGSDLIQINHTFLGLNFQN